MTDNILDKIELADIFHKDPEDLEQVDIDAIIEHYRLMRIKFEEDQKTKAAKKAAKNAAKDPLDMVAK